MKNKTMEKLIGPFELIARTYSKKWDIRIVPSGTSVATDGEIIYFPWNMSDIKGIPFVVLNGYLDHEVGHIREERRHKENGKRSVLQIMGEMRLRKQVTLSYLTNVFEDIRMETLYSKEYIGIAENLREVHLYSLEQAKKREDKSFWHSLGFCIIAEAYGSDSSEMFGDKYFPYIELCRSEIEESRHIQWAEESAELARRVYRKVSEYAEDLIAKEEERRAEERRESEGGMGGDTEVVFEPGEGGESGSASRPVSGDPVDGEGSSGSGDGESPDADDSASDTASESSEKSPESASEPKEEGSSGETEKEPSEAEKTARETREEAKSSDPLEELAKKIAEESEKERKKRGTYIPNPDILKLDKWEYVPRQPKEKFFELKQQVAAQTRAMRTKLQRRLRTLTDSHESYDRESGRLDDTVLSRLRLGEKRIFGTIVPGVKIDTAIQIVVDESGSMGGSSHLGTPAQKARLAVIGLCEALHTIKIPFEVIGFDNYGDYPSRSFHFVNRTPLRFHVYKEFRENYKRVETRLSGITGRGDNSDGEAIYACSLRLAERHEKRKIMFVFSDGAPCCYGLGPEGGEHLSQVVKKITSAGIEVLGIGLNTDSVKRYYSEENGAKWINITDIENLASDIFKIMSGNLMAGITRETRRHRA